MDILEAIYSRRATRAFTDQRVPETLLRKLIDAATHAPSALNRQPWLFSVVRGRERLAEISITARRHMLDSPLVVHSEHFRTVLSDPAYDIFYHAPVLIVISANAEGAWITEDCALAAENLMLAASGFGLGSCWIGFAQPWLNTPAGKKAIKLPETYVPVAPLILGYPRADPPAVPRNPPVINWVDG